MAHENHHPALHTLLRLDALTCVMMGILLVLAPEAIGMLTRLPASLLLWAGLVLFPVAGLMFVLSLMLHVPTLGALVVIAGNWLWVLASLLLPLLETITPNTLGWLFLLAQAAVVAGFAVLEQRAMPRPAAAQGL